MNAFTRRGACPALAAPMQTGDGLLVRLNTVTGGLSPYILIGLCKAGLRHGNGVVEVTARGSLQIRGLTDGSAPLFAAEVNALGIAVRTGVPVETSRLAGLDPDEIADPTGLAESIRRGIEAAGLTDRLGPKVSVVVDGGGRSGMATIAADVRLTAVCHEGEILWRMAVAGDSDTATPLGLLGDEAASDAAISVLAAVAARGREARARNIAPVDLQRLLPASPSSPCRDLLPVNGEKEAGRNDAAPPSPRHYTGRRSRQGDEGRQDHSMFGAFGLIDVRFALGVALPFGHTDADCLIDFAQKAEALGISDIRPAPRRAMLLLCPNHAAATAIQAEARKLGFVTDKSDPRAHIAACPGKPACASGHIPARDIATEIANGYSDFLDGSFKLHISGCAKGCAHPGAAALTLVGSEIGAGIIVGGTAKSLPDAYMPADGLVRAFGRVAGLVRNERRDGKSSGACLWRVGRLKIAKAFGKQ